MRHAHHIIPRHMGGQDTPENLAYVTIEEHAELHLVLYLDHGKPEDWYASQGLSGQLGKEDITLEMMRENGRKRGLANKGKTAWNKGKVMGEAYRKTLRNSDKVKPPSRKGAKHNEAARQKMREAWERRRNKYA